MFISVTFFIHSQRLAHAVGLYVDLECRCQVHLGLIVSNSYILQRKKSLNLKLFSTDDMYPFLFLKEKVALKSLFTF